LQVLNKMNEISKTKIPVIFGKRRSKDIMVSISNTKKFDKYFKWKPRFNDLKFILNTSYKWEKKIKSLKN